MTSRTRLEDLIGLEHTKLGFFRELQIKIRELQESNLKLEQKRSQIQGILDGISDVMAVVAPDFRIRTVNHVFHKTFRHPDPVGKFCYRVFRDRDRPCDPCPVVDALVNNAMRRHTFIYSINGSNRHFEITASPLSDINGEPRGILLLKRDVTVEKEYQAKFYHAEKMATIGLLAAGVAHEINNPLTAISGFAEGLRRRLPKLADRLSGNVADQKLAGDFQEYIDIIIAECLRCRDIVQNLLTFSPRERADFAPVALNSLVTDVLKLLEHQLKKKLPKAICLDLDPVEPRTLGVAAELKQVVLNLILNALDAIQEKGNITIRTRNEDECWCTLSVDDTGCGIAREHLDKLFDPFFTTKPVGKGIGVGLSTCYNIILQHQGEILVDSREGKGASFRVRLPLLS